MRPLLLSYGGGHAVVMIAVARELSQRGVPYDLLGLTTAYATFHRAGLPAMDVTSLVDEQLDGDALQQVKPYLPKQGHADISDTQTHAYFALGYADLTAKFGIEEAKTRLKRDGRKAFEPVSIFQRWYHSNRPSVVVATTSPRFELAALRAARRESIPSLAIGDQFLTGQADFIVSGDYADHLVLLSEEVEGNLRREGLSQPRVHLLGNPAFDSLAPRSDDAKRREKLRARLGFEGKRVLFWPLGGGRRSGSGELLLSPTQVREMLEEIAHEDSDLRYLLRPHPNWPVDVDSSNKGCMCPDDFSPEDCLLVADLVVAESSTLGLQAVLKGIPTISFGHADYNVYPRYGWASIAGNSEELRDLVIGRTLKEPPIHLRQLVGRSSALVADLIENLHTSSLKPKSSRGRSPGGD